MATVKDWMSEAADRICREVGQRNVRTYLQVAAIIAEHSPMRPDMAYMLVPRCDQCRWWSADVLGAPVGYCNKGVVEEDLGTRADFGCVQFKAK